MLPIKIGNLISIDNTYAPLVNLSFEYFRTQGGEIIGGIKKYTINGVITVSDDGSSSSGSTVMSKLKTIRDLGKKTKCYDVEIPNYYTGLAKITNVSITQGPDPSWINQGEFSIELTAPLSEIPFNSLKVTASDYVTDISKSETLELGEDSHGYAFDLNGKILSKSYVKFKTEISVTCKPLCTSLGGTQANAISIINRLYNITPQNEAFKDYKTWKPYLQSRSLDINTEGTASFRSEIILVPPNFNITAFVDLNYEYGKTYQSNEESRKISGSITGLVSIDWKDLVSLSDTSSNGKFAAAESAFGAIRNLVKSLTDWQGLMQDLIRIPNCPIRAAVPTTPCIQPTSAVITKSRTEGIITFDYEWSSGDKQCAANNGSSTVLSIDITDERGIVEYVIPDRGTLIQNLNTNKARIIDITSTSTVSEGCITDDRCVSDNVINAQIERALLSGNPGLNPNGSTRQWLLIEDTITRTLNSIARKKKFIRRCLR